MCVYVCVSVMRLSVCERVSESVYMCVCVVVWFVGVSVC